MTTIGTPIPFEGHDPQPSLVRAFRANKLSSIGLVLFLAVVLIAAAAPLLTVYDPFVQDVTHKLASPSAAHIFGTDEYGRDIWARMIYGARLSLLIGLASTAVAIVVGSLIGIVAGWYGGRLDAFAMQVMDVLLAFPSLILGMIVVAMLGPSLANIILAIALTAIPAFARIASAPTIALKEPRLHRGLPVARLLDAAHPGPARAAQHLRRDPGDGIAVARQCHPHRGLARLHRPRPAPADADLGRHDPRRLRQHPGQPLAGGGAGPAVLIVIFSLNLIGDGLRDAVDPKLQGRRMTEPHEPLLSVEGLSVSFRIGRRLARRGQ